MSEWWSYILSPRHASSQSFNIRLMSSLYPARLLSLRIRARVSKHVLPLKKKKDNIRPSAFLFRIQSVARSEDIVLLLAHAFMWRCLAGANTRLKKSSTDQWILEDASPHVCVLKCFGHTHLRPHELQETSKTIHSPFTGLHEDRRSISPTLDLLFLFYPICLLTVSRLMALSRLFTAPPPPVDTRFN